MKNILVPIETHSSLDSVLATAVLLGKRLSGTIAGVTAGPNLPNPLVGFDLEGTWAAAEQTARRELSEEGRRRFEDFMRTNAVPARQTTPHRGLCCNLLEDSLTDSQIGGYARIFDLSVVGRPGAEQGNPRMATLEGALFDSGRPVVLAPPDAPVKLGDTIVIAWTRSIECARTTALAMPLLALARKVVLLTIVEDSLKDPLAELMADNLQANDIPAQAVTRSGKDRALGEAWLEEAASLGADLLIKGGYTRSRIRKLIFGDATSHVLAHAKLPVLMAS